MIAPSRSIADENRNTLASTQEPHLRKVGHRVEPQSPKDCEQRLDDGLVMRDHGWVPQRAHKRVNGNGRVVLLAAGDQAGRREQLVPCLSLYARS